MYKRINVVTGANGRIGFAVCDELKKRGEYVRALVRKNSVGSEFLKQFCDELVFADVTDVGSLAAAFCGAEAVFHLAGIITIESRVTGEEQLVNIEGTRNVCESCIATGVRKLVYTGSVQSLDFENNKQIISEPNRYSPEKVMGGYAKSKAEASNIVLDYADKGLDAVIGLPSSVLGAFEYKRSNFGQMIVDVANKKLPAYVTGRYDFVDVRDVAAALCDLRDVGAKGESYIISGHIMSVGELVKMTAAVAKVKPPMVCLPNWFLKLIAHGMEKSALKKGKKPMFTPYSMAVLKDNCNFSHKKLTELTGYNPRPLQSGIQEQVDFYRNVTKPYEQSDR